VKLVEEVCADVGYMPMTTYTVLIQKIIDFKTESPLKRCIHIKTAIDSIKNNSKI
jgi:hypothetical protein